MLHLRRDGRKTLSIFVTAGYPSMGATVPLTIALKKAGADLIELGLPFSDPIADGPTIQKSSEIALRNGVTIKKTLSIAGEIRRHSDVPLVLMGYANPIFSFGMERFLSASREVGVDGTIIADLPLEESEDYRRLASRFGISTIFLATPTTPDERLVQLDDCSTGFLYCVSVSGVTGERPGLENQTLTFLKRTKALVKKNPLLVGFGIATPEDARQISMFSDGVIIGSALIKMLNSTPDDHIAECACDFVRSMRIALG